MGQISTQSYRAKLVANDIILDTFNDEDLKIMCEILLQNFVDLSNRMANTLDETKYDLDSAIPSGSWTLYFHSPEETKWTLNTFINLGSMKNWTLVTSSRLVFSHEIKVCLR